jgi:hypothetical protein
VGDALDAHGDCNGVVVSGHGAGDEQGVPILLQTIRREGDGGVSADVK